MKEPISNQIDQEFLSEENFEITMNRIYGKIRERKKILHQKKYFQNIDLVTIIKNKKEFHETIKDYVVNHEISMSPLKLVELVTNKKRDIYIANWAERILLMMAQNTFSKFIEKYLSQHTYAFRKGMGPSLAKKKLCEFLKQNKNDLYIYQGDISSYGESIDQKTLDLELSKIKELEGSKLQEIIKKSIKAKYINKDQEVTIIDKGVPSGSPLVPVLENFYLKEMDFNLSQNRTSFYARYGDDFVIICKSIDEICKQEAWLFEYLIERGLQIKPEKVKKTWFTENKEKQSDYIKKNSIEWIGVKFNRNGKTSLKNEKYKLLKQKTANEINELFIKVKKNIHSEENQLIVLKNGITEVLSLASPQIKKFIIETNNQEIIKQFHYSQTVLIQRLYRKVLHQDGRKAWRSTRKTMPSLESFLKSKAE